MPVSNGTNGNDDILAGGAGSIIDGDAGNDKLTLDRSGMTADMTLTFASGSATPSVVGDGTTFVNIEHLFLSTGTGNNVVTLNQPNYDTTWGGNSLDMTAGGRDIARVNLSTESLAVSDSYVGGTYSVIVGGNTVVTITGAERLVITGGSAADTLSGSPVADVLTGGGGNDTLSGGSGDDFLAGGAGDDILDGGAGNDGAYYNNGDTSAVTANLSTGTATGTNFGTDTLISIENLTCGAGDDNLTGSDVANQIDAGTGTNVVNAGGGDDYIYDWGTGSTIDGGAGSDLVYIDRHALTASLTGTFTSGATTNLSDGTSIRNAEHLQLVSGSGDDAMTFVAPGIAPLGENNYWGGGAGTDTLTLDLSNISTGVSISGGTWQTVSAGTTVVFAYADIEYLNITGGSGNDELDGGSYADQLVGGAGNDVLRGGAGADVLSGGNDEDTLWGGEGDDTLDGGSSVDTAVFAGGSGRYTITQTSTGTFTVAGPDGTDTLTRVEYARFDNETIRLLPGSGTTVNFAADPSTYMGAIRDFDGNNLGGAASWKLIGAADVNGDGRAEHILFNREIGRWAEVGTEADGLTYFGNNGWAGDTRVVGIYIDPLVANGTVVKDSDFDSQRRFQNDLRIDNIHGILGQADYNHDGLQEVYFSLTDGTAYLHAYMHADGNIQYANYQNKQQVIDYLTTNGYGSASWSGWFPASQVLATVAGG